MEHEEILEILEENLIDNVDIFELIEELTYYNHFDDKNCKHQLKLENKYNLENLDVRVVKHNQLQYTYYYEIDFGEKYPILSVEIESGINNGTQINHVGWNSSTLPSSRTVEVLKDVIFSEEGFRRWCNRKDVSEERASHLRQIAISLFERNKSELMKANKNKSYDNYVTGGGTLKTNEYYRNFYNDLEEKGVFWEFIYEEKEYDVNFI